MALFSKKATAKAEPKSEKAKKEVKKAKVEKSELTLKVKAERDAAYTKSGGLDLTMVLLRPHVTEKATDLSERSVYAFEINKLANKMHVRQAVERFYKVKPVKVAVINIMPKYAKNPRTGRVQTKKQGLKKAFVYLKKGDKIEFV
jgi:large subunit ribosomal protein L23